MDFGLTAIIYHTGAHTPSTIEIMGLVILALIVKATLVTGRLSTSAITYLQTRWKWKIDRVACVCAIRLISLTVVMHIAINAWNITTGIIAIYPPIIMATVFLWLMTIYPPGIYFLRSYYNDCKIEDAVQARTLRSARPGEFWLILLFGMRQYWAGHWRYRGYYDEWRQRVEHVPVITDYPVYMSRVKRSVEALKSNRILRGGMILDNTVFNLYFEGTRYAPYLKTGNTIYMGMVGIIWVLVATFTLNWVLGLKHIEAHPITTIWAFILMAIFYYATATIVILVSHLTIRSMDTDPPFAQQYTQHIKRKQYRIQASQGTTSLQRDYLKRYRVRGGANAHRTVLCAAVKSSDGVYYWGDLGARHYNLVGYAVNLTGITEGYAYGYVTEQGKWICSRKVAEYLGEDYPWFDKPVRDRVLTENLC